MLGLKRKEKRKEKKQGEKVEKQLYEIDWIRGENGENNAREKVQ